MALRTGAAGSIGGVCWHLSSGLQHIARHNAVRPLYLAAAAAYTLAVLFVGDAEHILLSSAVFMD